MPLYEYKCVNCGEVFEKMKSMSKCQEDDICPKCGSEARKIFSIPTRYKGQKGNWNR